MTELDILKQLKIDLAACPGISNVDIYYEEVTSIVTKTYLDIFPTPNVERTKTNKWVILADWKCYWTSNKNYKVDPSTSLQVTKLLLRESSKLTELTGDTIELTLTKRKLFL